MQRKDRVRLEDMLDNAEKALGFVNGRKRDDLETDVMLRYAVVRAIEVVGEAAAKVSPETRGRMTAVPWRQIIGMRNRIVHRYSEINNDVLWMTLQSELPALLPLLHAALAAS